MGDDEVGLDVADDLDHGGDEALVVGIDFQIVHVHADHLLCAHEFSALAGLANADSAQLVGLDDHMALAAVGHVADRHLVAAVGVFANGAAGGDFDVVGMAADGQNFHACFLLQRTFMSVL